MPQFSPNPGPQTSFLKSPADYIFYGGARGGGKSFILAYHAAFSPCTYSYSYKRKPLTKTEYNEYRKDGKQPAIHVNSIRIDYPDYIGLLIRRTFPQLQRNLKPECEKLYPLYGGRWVERHKYWEFPSGAKIYMVHLQDIRALNDYIGGNYNFIGVDEANMFPYEYIEKLTGSLRSNNPNIKPQMCLTGNPGNIGHVWLNKNYVKKCPAKLGKKLYSKEFDVYYYKKTPGPVFVDEEGITHQFIPSTVFDNPHIIENDKSYVRKLKKLSPILRAMWLDGDFDVFQGMYFSNWNSLHHIIPSADFCYGTHFTKDTHMLYRAYDYGTKKSFVCLFIAVNRDGNAIIFDEIVETGLSASKQAAFVNDYTKKTYGLSPEDFADNPADPAYWVKASEDRRGNLYSPADFYADAGIYLTAANNDRKTGAKVVYEALEVPDQGPPLIRFTDKCEYCIETIPNLPGKDTDPEDIDTRAEDHAYDALRYWCMEFWGASIVPTIEPDLKNDWRARLADQAENQPDAPHWRAA